MQYRTVPLSQQQVLQAFPLVQLMNRATSLEQWQNFANSMLRSVERNPDPPRGIMTLSDERGYLLGMFVYMIEPHLVHGRTLAIDNFVLVGGMVYREAARTLLGAIENLAFQHDCAAVHIMLPRESLNLVPEANPFRRIGMVPAERPDELVRLCWTAEPPRRVTH